MPAVLFRFLETVIAYWLLVIAIGFCLFFMKLNQFLIDFKLFNTCIVYI